MAAAALAEETDPILHLLPDDQMERVLGQHMCDIDPSFLGFTAIYLALAGIIPKHWTIIDLGCAYSPQAFVFKDHKAYIGVDLYTKERFASANTRHYEMPIADFIEKHADSFEKDTTFAICSYVPPWHSDNMALARAAFKNVFTYYPAGSAPNVPFSHRIRKE